MKQLLIDRGVYHLGMKKSNGEGTPPKWESDEQGMTIAIGDIEESETSGTGADNGELVHIVQRYTLLDIIAERLNLPPAEDLPDVRDIAKALHEDGIDICEYCNIVDCRMCLIREG